MSNSPLANIPPSPNPSEPPDFWRMESKVFEELTCALLDKEPDVKNADLFHIDGQSQYGIDSWADMRHELAVVVASSKCYQIITATQIGDWSDDFLKHYDSYWKARNVRRFILAVSSPVHERKLSDKVVAEKVRFRSLGMEYEVWGPRQFQSKLRHQRGIVTQFLGGYWANVICGEVPVGASAVGRDQSAVIDFFTTSINSLVTALNAEADGKLDSLKARLREESPRGIVRELENMRSSAHWPSLAENVRSKCLRYLASAKLQEWDVAAATAFADEADTLSADGSVMFRALLTAHQGDQEKALSLLEDSSEPDAQEIRAALLLQAGRLDEVEWILDRLPAVNGQPTVEASRLRAFLLLFRGKRSAALSEIRRVEARAPRWFSVRRAGAVIRYANALSKIVGEEHFANPAPVAAELVRQDDTSQALLREALATFDSLATERQESPAGLYDELWALACECNLADGLSSAQRRSDRLLGADPASPEVISWALTRGLKFDQKSSREALRNATERSDKDAAHVLAYSWLLTLDSNDIQAKEVLQSNRELFNNEAQRAAYKARIGYLEPSPVDSGVSPTQDNISIEGRIFSIISNASETLAWEKLEALFASLASRNSQSVALLAAASRLAAAGRWRFLCRYVQLLIKFETASAIEIAAHAAFNAGNPELALTVLESNRTAFPHGKFPRNLAAIEAHSLAEQGEHRQALNAAERLSLEFDGFRERMLPADIRLKIGDIRGTFPVIRDVISKNELPAGEALRWARFVALEDRELARNLLRHAAKNGLSEEFAIEAHIQATRLGLDKEAVVFETAVATKMSRPDEGRFRLMSFEEFRQFQAERAQTRLNFWNAYLDGAVPFHIVAEPADIDFSGQYYIGSPVSFNAESRPPLMIRHGARGVDFDTGLGIRDWRLHIDVSSLLLAKQLGILETIESAVTRIIVPQSIQSQLITFADSLEHPQPKRFEVESAIYEGLHTGTIGVWEQPKSIDDTELLSSGNDETWTVISNNSESVSESAHHATLASVLEGIRRAGHIDALEFQEALSGFALVESGVPCPLPGARLRFTADSLGVLALKCPLQAILKTFVVSVDSEFAAVLTQSVRATRARQDMLKVVNELRAHIANQFLSGNYETAKNREGQAEADADEDSSADFRIQIQGLLEFLRCQPVTNAVFCVDDRFVSGYPRFGEAPVVGIYELLRALRDERVLSDSDYFAKLLHLRGANTMFLPIEAEEVLFHLGRAVIVDGQVVETHALSVLKRYMAQVSLQERHLKVGDFPAIKSDRPDEIFVFISMRRVTDQCLEKIWPSKTNTDSQCEAWATWIWSQLRMERPLGEHPSIKTDRNSLATFTAVTFSAALTTIIQLAAGHSKTRRESYSRWLSDCVIKNRFHTDQLLATHILTQFKLLLNGVLNPSESRGEPKHSDELVAAYLRDALDLLPEELRDRLLSDLGLQRRLKTKIVTVVNVGEIQLLRDSFIPAVRRAMKTGRSQTKANESTDVVTFRAVKPEGTLAIRCRDTAVQINDPAFLLFKCSSEGHARSFLNGHLAWFDRSEPERKLAIDLILGTKAPAKQYEALDRVRRESLAFRYKEIEDQLEEKHTISLAKCGSPHPEDVYRHLRIEAGSGQFSERWARSANALLAECSLEETFLRLGCLPVPLPRAFVERFMNVSPEEQQSAGARIARLGACSAVHFFHALSLLRSERLAPEVRALGSQLATDVLARWDGLASAMGALLMWSEAQAHQMSDWRARSIEEQLVSTWYHAVRLLCLLNRNHDMESQISEQFGKARGAMSANAAFSGLTRSADCASPNTFVGVVFLYGGMSYALQALKVDSMLSTQQQEMVFALTRVNNNVNPWLMASRELSPNRLNSFLRVDVPVDAGCFALPPALSENFESELIKALETAPSNPMVWLHLYTLTRMGLSAINRRRFVKIVEKAQLMPLAELEADVLIAWRSLAGCVRLLGNGEAQIAFKAQLLKLAGALSERYKGAAASINVDGDDERARRLNELLEACITFSRSDDVAQAYEDIAELFLGVATVWKAARATISRTLETIYDDSEISDTGAIWNALVRLRAQP